MTELVLTTLGNAYDVRDGTHDSPRYHDHGYPLITSKNLKNGFLNFDNVKFISEHDFIQINQRSAVDDGDVLFAMIGTIGNPVIVGNVRQFAIKNVALFKIDPAKNSNRFLKYYLESPQVIKKMQRDAKGTTQKFVGLGYLRQFPIQLPPLEQQKRIVEVLDEALSDIDKARQLTEQNLKNARELFESYFEYEMSRNDGDWKNVTIGQIGKVSMCKRILKKQTSKSGDIPFYKIGTFGRSPDAFISRELYQHYRSNYSFPKIGDVLLSASGTIGRRVVYDGQPAYFQDSNIVWIDNDEKEVINSYLYYFYEICDWNPSKGATISRLYNDDLRRIKISYPPKSKQIALVDKFEKLKNNQRKLETNYRLKISLLEQLRDSLLAKTFSGQLAID